MGTSQIDEESVQQLVILSMSYWYFLLQSSQRQLTTSPPVLESSVDAVNVATLPLLALPEHPRRLLALPSASIECVAVRALSGFRSFLQRGAGMIA